MPGPTIRNYWCIICFKKFDTPQALAGHIRMEHPNQLVRRHFCVPKNLWEEFREVCYRRGSNPAYALNELIKAVVRAEREGVATVVLDVFDLYAHKPTPNPIIVRARLNTEK